MNEFKFGILLQLIANWLHNNFRIIIKYKKFKLNPNIKNPNKNMIYKIKHMLNNIIYVKYVKYIKQLYLLIILNNEWWLSITQKLTDFNNMY